MRPNQSYNTRSYHANGEISKLLRHSHSAERSIHGEREKENRENNSKLMNLSQMFQGSKLSEMLKNPRENSKSSHKQS